MKVRSVMVTALILSLGHKDDASGAGIDRKAGLKRWCGDQRVIEGGVFGGGGGVDGANAKDKLLLLQCCSTFFFFFFFFFVCFGLGV